MELQLQHELRQRLKILLQQKQQPPNLPFEIPVHLFTDPHIYENEIQRLFKKQLLPVAPLAQLQHAGDFITTEIMGRSLLAARDYFGQLRVFHNVCRHRGAKVAQASAGSGCKKFQCPYHGWTYQLTGELTAVPEMATFGALQTADYGLVELPSQSLAGFLWVALEPESNPTPTYEPLKRELDSFAVEHWELYGTQQSIQPFNWKIAIHAFLEGYHFRFAHSETAAKIYVHNQILCHDHSESVRIVIPKLSILDQFKQADESWSLLSHVNILYFIFPSSFFFFINGQLAFLKFIPQSIDSTLMQLNFLVPNKPSNEKERSFCEKNYRFFIDVTEEDLVIARGIQQGLSSNANRHFIYGAYESEIERFQKNLSRYIGNHSPAPS